MQVYTFVLWCGLLVSVAAFTIPDNSSEFTKIDSFLETAANQGCKCKNGRCMTDNRGKTKCNCPPGYALQDDFTCEKCDCGKMGKCIFMPQAKVAGGNQFVKKCICDNGSAEKDGICVEINPCDTNNGECEHDCIYENDIITCKCNSGFILQEDKKSCKKMTPCDTNNGGCQQVCKYENEELTCECNSGFILQEDKKSCKIDYCKKCSAITGAICDDSKKFNPNVECKCEKEEHSIDYSDNTCKGVVTTVHEDTTPVTESSTIEPTDITEDTTTVTESSTIEPTDITGKITSTLPTIQTSVSPIIDPCDLNPCKNGGICKVKGKEAVCYCPSPFSGKYCDMDPCSNNPCQNGGTCFLNGASFRCMCRDPFIGKTCEANPCMWNPCKNGGICKLVNKSARCFCDNPFAGEFCENEKGNGLTITMLAVVISLLIVILMLVSCVLCQRFRSSKTSRPEKST